MTLSIATWDDFLAGWSECSETWTYSSVSGITGTVTIATDGTTRFAKGDKVRFKQGGAFKYFYIISVNATTLVINGGTDYTLVNSTITNVAVSRILTPVGFPQRFKYTPTFTGFSANPTMDVYFTINGQICHLSWQTTATGTSSSTDFKISLPVTAGAGYWYVNNAFQGTSGGAYADRVDGTIFNLSTTLDFSRNGGTAGFTGAGAKGCSGEMWYFI